MTSNQDRSGEKLNFDERANEDTYFAAKEHELIEEMKTEFRKVDAARREAQIINCPSCPGKLDPYSFLGFVLSRCDSCEGIWLKRGELTKILRQQARGPLGAFLDRCFSKDAPATKS
jgi:Zn-finger nucleic acid-binding protein